MTTRKITFPTVGIVQGSRVWRNHETGVEIIKGENFAEVGLYYVCTPALTTDGRTMVRYAPTLSEARGLAAVHAGAVRGRIAKAHTAALLEDSDRNGKRLAATR